MNFTENEIKFMICDVALDNPNSPAHLALINIFQIDEDRWTELIQYTIDSIHAANVAMKAICNPDDPESLR